MLHGACSLAPMQMVLLPWCGAAWGGQTPSLTPLHIPRDTKPAILHREDSALAVTGSCQNQALLGLARPSAEAGRLGSYCFQLGGAGEFFIS